MSDERLLICVRALGTGARLLRFSLQLAEKPLEATGDGSPSDLVGTECQLEHSGYRRVTPPVTALFLGPRTGLKARTEAGRMGACRPCGLFWEMGTHDWIEELSHRGRAATDLAEATSTRPRAAPAGVVRYLVGIEGATMPSLTTRAKSREEAFGAFVEMFVSCLAPGRRARA